MPSCPKPAPNSWGVRGAQGSHDLALCFISSLSSALPHGVVFDCGFSVTVSSLYGPHPRAPPACPLCREPCSRLVYLGVPPGFGEPASPAPQHWNLFVFLHWGWRAQGALRGKSPPHPQMLLLLPGRGNPTPTSESRCIQEFGPWVWTACVPKR